MYGTYFQKKLVDPMRAFWLTERNRLKRETIRLFVTLITFLSALGLMTLSQMESDRWFDYYTRQLILNSAYKGLANEDNSFVEVLGLDNHNNTMYAIEPLHDRIFEYLPNWSSMRNWLPDTLLISLLLSSIFFNLIWISKPTIDWQGFIVFRRILWILTFLYIFRTLSFMITTVPNPIYNCVPKYVADNLLKSKNQDRLTILNRYISLIGDMVSGKVSACTDNIYSGHTALITTCVFTFFAYNHSLILKLYALLHAALAIIAILITRLHYSIDVLVALFVTSFVYLTFHFILAIYLSRELLKSHNHLDNNQILFNECKSASKLANISLCKLIYWMDGMDIRMPLNEELN